MRSKIAAFILTALLLIIAFPVSAAVTSEQAYKSASNYMLQSVPNPSFGNEWFIISLARGNAEVPEQYYDTYYQNVVSHVKQQKGELHNRKYTEYSRLIIALAAIGKDATNVGGYNLVEKLYNFENVVWQGLNGPIFALIALDTWQYDIPKDAKNSREQMLSYILSKQLTDGGFTLSGTTADTDMTAMAIQSLAPYQNDPKVKQAIERALSALQQLQQSDGSYESWDTPNSESAAQVITALSSIGVNITDDKNFNKVYSAFMNFYDDEDGGFKHVLSEKKSNGMATEQAGYALASYYRLQNGLTPLYVMSDTKPTNTNTPKQPIEKPTSTFSDTSKHWAKDDIANAVTNGLLKGYQDGTFKPNNSLTRGQATSIVVRALQLKNTGNAPFSDISKLAKDTQAEIAAAYEAGLIVITTKKFAPSTPISRQELAIMLARAYAYKTGHAYVPQQNAPFKDLKGLSKEAQQAITFLYDFDISQGSNGAFNPNNKTTRAHAAKIFNNFVKAVK